MVGAMHHRGPDDSGVHLDLTSGVALGHTRLAIIDLSPAGHQPMSYAGGRYQLVFNGEIYNFGSLREELELLGHRFASHTDSEVILAAYQQWGDGCLGRFQGMFAFAIWDAERKRIFLARDRFGIKPLYYQHTREHGLIFASEIKALLASGCVARAIDRQAVWDYLSWGSVSQPRTILRDVRMLPPGYLAHLTEQGLALRQYWDIHAATRAQASELADIGAAEAAARLRSKLEAAIRAHQVADVPVGAFLSGGIDSTVIVGLMSAQSTRPINTFTVGFGSRHQNLNELNWARETAARFGCCHHEVILDGSQVASDFGAMIDGLDQPSVDGANTYFVSEATARSVRVAVSGLGSDELFGGYNHFRDRGYRRGWHLPPAWALAEALGARTHPRLRRPLQMLGTPIRQRHELLRHLLSDGDKRRVVRREWLRPGPWPRSRSGQPRDPGGLGDFERLSYLELTGYMVNTLLRDGDSVSMAHSLEVRPVFLDHPLAEFAFALPRGLKEGEFAGKRILVDACADLLDPSFLVRPKRGFELPLVAWMRGELREQVRAAFASPIAARIFQPRFLAQKESQLAGARAGHAFWSEFILVAYCERLGLDL